ncbi:MAG: hypothetical protein JNK05_23010 [Myxococcales bacterium]|nr:hypothetical protein [Myxococcales bacterium]
MRTQRFILCALLVAACSPANPPVDGGMDVSVDTSTDGSTSPDASDSAAMGDSDPLPDGSLPERMPGQRAPLTAMCDPADPARCLLPWPSNVFTRVDSASGTGLRLSLSSRVATGDDNSSLERANGFSRVTPIVTVVTGAVDAASLGEGTTGAIRLVRASPGAMMGTLVPLRIRAVESRATGRPETVIIAYPLAPLEAATDYVVALMDSVRTTDGPGPMPDALARASLGLAPPTTGTEARYAAYHAPSRMALQRASVDSARVVRIWDFTTRSDEDALRDTRAMRAQMLAAIDAGTYGVSITSVTAPATGDIGLIVDGRLTGLPDFLDRAAMKLARNADGTVRAAGMHDAPFRVTIPRGTGNYRAILFGHGLGGDYSDDSFDVDIARVGAAKVGVRFAGLTGADVIETIGGLSRAAAGSEWAAALTQQSLVDACAIQRALAGRLGDALAAPMLGTMANPAAGRRVDTTRQVWAGGSLGGTMGLVYAQLEPSIEAAVLNVPGAAWTGYLVLSSVFSLGRGVLLANYRTDVNLQLAVAIAQSNFDGIDGANWASSSMARRVPQLVQQSMGDPVLPGPGTEMVASVTGAQQIGAPLSTVYRVTRATEDRVDNGVAFTQYRVPSTVTGAYDVHGFAARDTPAGLAAREQIFAFIQSVWMGMPRATLPPRCVSNTPANSCDFAAAR